jgi:ABC-type antimicrobial peptide transport system permease subunit
VGQRIRLGTDSAQDWATIIGVVPDLGRPDREGADNDGVYLSLLQTGDRSAAVVIRTTSDPLTLIPTLRSVLSNLDADVPLFGEARLDDVITRATAGEKVFGGLFMVFGVSALVMASVGLFGMVTFAVRQRSRELGIRVALGARPAQVVGQVTRVAVLQLGVGLVVGLSLASLLAPLLGDALMGSDPHDWRLYGLVGLALTAAGAAACWVPARRALRLAPSEVLREE